MTLLKKITLWLLVLALLCGQTAAALGEGEMVLLDEYDEQGKPLEEETELEETELEEAELVYEETAPTAAPETPASMQLIVVTPAPATPVPAPTATPAPEANALHVGDTGALVKQLQTRLAELGYYTGKISGYYGENTRRAVAAFQADFGLNPNGLAGDATQSAMLSAQYRPLRYGSSGEDVKRLQKRLALLGYYGGKVSGNYLDSTGAAVAAFRQKMGWGTSPEAEPELQALLFSTDAREAVASAVTAAPGVVVRNAQPTPQGPNPSPTVAFEKKLSYETTGAAVKTLQERLTELGYYTGPISGNFLGHTRNAVKAFQKQNALNADGVVGEGTWNAIFNDPDVVRPGEPAKVPLMSDALPYHLVVDVTNQIVTVFVRNENGEYTIPIKDMMCSSGTRNNPSPIGDWVLNGRHTTWCYFPTWGDYARYWTQITPSVAFHSVLYNSVDVMDLRTKSYRMLGSRASHGCVRLQVADAKWIYDYVDKGTVVTITASLDSDPEKKASQIKPALNTKNMLPVATPKPTQEPVYVSGAEPPLPLQKLSVNSSGKAVWWLQNKLAELGYYTGRITGTYLDGTKNAVKAFQKAHGLNASGTADVRTLEVLYAGDMQMATPAPTAAPIATPAPTPAAEDIPTAAPESEATRRPSLIGP